jgi:hypothetical protein
MEIALSHISDPPPAPRSLNKDIPAAVERELLKALEKEPEKRHRSASEFVRSIRQAYGDIADAPAAKSSAKVKTAVAPVVSDSWTLSDANDSVAKARSKLQASIKTEAKSEGKSRSKLPLIVGAVVILIALAAVVLFSQQGNATVAAGDGAPIALIYSDSGFTMVNSGDYTLDVNELKFVRGVDGGGDDFNGFRIAKKILPGDSCARIILQGKQINAPPQCSTIQSTELLSNQALFFWRKEAEGGTTISSFEVWYKGNMVQRCDTIARGGDGECRFVWPVPPPTLEPEDA